MINGIIKYLKRDDVSTDEKFGMLFLLVTIIVALIYFVLRVREDSTNPCLEYKTETICSGAGDAYGCSEVYTCIKRKND